MTPPRSPCLAEHPRGPVHPAPWGAWPSLGERLSRGGQRLQQLGEHVRAESSSGGRRDRRSQAVLHGAPAHMAVSSQGLLPPQLSHLRAVSHPEFAWLVESSRERGSSQRSACLQQPAQTHKKEVAGRTSLLLPTRVRADSGRKVWAASAPRPPAARRSQAASGGDPAHWAPTPSRLPEAPGAAPACWGV